MLPSPRSGWDVLFTERGAELLAELEGEGGSDPLRAGAALRSRGIPADEVAALLSQAELRRRAVAKFGPSAGRLLFTPAGLEQATRAPVAALHASRFAGAGCRVVADLGCGIGAESIALALAGVSPRPVEIDPLTARIAEHNLSAVGHPSPVAVGDAETLALPGDADGVFLDPARRTAGHRDTRRITRPGDYSPSLDFAFGQALPTGVKLGPGFDRELIPEEAEAQWVSVDGQLVETGLWFGAVAREGVRRSALVLQSGSAHEITAAADAQDAELRSLGEFVYEPDGAVIRARLIGALARELGAGMLGDRIAYLTGDRLLATPFAAAFRVVEELPFKEKQLRRALAERGIGSLEIKKRGVDVDPAALRKRLGLRGERAATLILTRVSGRHTALLVERSVSERTSVT